MTDLFKRLDRPRYAKAEERETAVRPGVAPVRTPHVLRSKAPTAAAVHTKRAVAT